MESKASKTDPDITLVSLFLFCLSHQRECAVMTTDRTTGIGKWDQRSCSDKNGYICLRNLGEPRFSNACYIYLFNCIFIL